MLLNKETCSLEGKVKTKIWSIKWEGAIENALRNVSVNKRKSINNNDLNKPSDCK